MPRTDRRRRYRWRKANPWEAERNMLVNQHHELGQEISNLRKRIHISTDNYSTRLAPEEIIYVKHAVQKIMSKSTRLGITLSNFKGMGEVSEPMTMLHDLLGRTKLLESLAITYQKKQEMIQ